MRPLWTLATAAVTLVLGGCGGGDGQGGAPTVPDNASWTTIADVDGASLSRLGLSDGTKAYLQRIDLHRVAIEQVIGDRDPGATIEAGRYFPSGTSPRFVRIPPSRAHETCRAGLFSVVNFAFFEEYEPSTRLSFPVRSHGALLTAGSSPYGPIDQPSDAHYRTVTLQAFTWNGSGAAIGPYDPQHGTPLDASPDGLVTYAYRDHPSYVLDRDPPNRYQLLGLVDGQHLLGLTVEHARLETAADLLRAQGAVGEILALDGGPSTYLWQATLGELVPITNREGTLPHYLCLRAGGG